MIRRSNDCLLELFLYFVWTNKTLRLNYKYLYIVFVFIGHTIMNIYMVLKILVLIREWRALTKWLYRLVIIIPAGLSFRRKHLHRAPQQPSNPISELRLVTSDAPLSDDRRSRIDRFVETWNRPTELIILWSRYS